MDYRATYHYLDRVVAVQFQEGNLRPFRMSLFRQEQIRLNQVWNTQPQFGKP